MTASVYDEHIVGIHEHGKHQEQLWISMDLCGRNRCRKIVT